MHRISTYKMRLFTLGKLQTLYNKKMSGGGHPKHPNKRKMEPIYFHFLGGVKKKWRAIFSLKALKNLYF